MWDEQKGVISLSTVWGEAEAYGGRATRLAVSSLWCWWVDFSVGWMKSSDTWLGYTSEWFLSRRQKKGDDYSQRQCLFNFICSVVSKSQWIWMTVWWCTNICNPSSHLRIWTCSPRHQRVSSGGTFVSLVGSGRCTTGQRLLLPWSFYSENTMLLQLYIDHCCKTRICVKLMRVAAKPEHQVNPSSRSRRVMWHGRVNQNMTLVFHTNVYFYFFKNLGIFSSSSVEHCCRCQ